jgi:hypothetical protein
MLCWQTILSTDPSYHSHLLPRRGFAFNFEDIASKKLTNNSQIPAIILFDPIYHQPHAIVVDYELPTPISRNRRNYFILNNGPGPTK